MHKLMMNGQDVSNSLLEFTQRLVQTQSYTGQEEAVAHLIAAKMAELGYDEVKIDAYGNVVGRVGIGKLAILFDSHMDTVIVSDAEEWSLPPFSGEIKDGYLWGRGSVDMKAGLAASVYAAAIAKSQGLLDGKTVYVTCTVVEEDCDGEGLKAALEENHLHPDYAVICEPSSNLISTGHKGKAQIIVQTQGVSAHGSAPEKGVNAVYEMAEIIQRIEQTNLALAQKPGRHGTLVLAQIASTGVSLNAVPYVCEVYLDRRLVVGETEESLNEEMARIIQGKHAAWKYDIVKRKTWTGADITYNPLAPAWEISLEHPLAQAFIAACTETHGKSPDKFEYWDFSTNAIAAVRKGIPTIGFGPGEHKLAHTRDEKCSIAQIVEACAVYTRVIDHF